MRFSGQGLMSHTASTTISRYFTKTRGKALSISWFGLSSAEFIMPVLMVYLLTIISWQNLWVIFSITVLIFLPIVSFSLIKNLNLDLCLKTEINSLLQAYGLDQDTQTILVKLCFGQALLLCHFHP